MKRRWDAIIVGGGPAGLAAALLLGRCCRSVLVCDRGTPRSWASKAMHGFPGHDGLAPAEFVKIASTELRRYPNVTLLQREVDEVRPTGKGFSVRAGNRQLEARKVLIATGVADELPPIEGLLPLYGTSVFPCPYCDGWEFRGRRVAVYGRRRRGLEMARAMTAWTRDILLCSDGPTGFTRREQRELMANGIRHITTRVRRLEGSRGLLSAVVFTDGCRVARDALFFDTPAHAQSPLASRLGCRFNRRGGVECGDYEATSVPGVYVAGNIVKDVQLAIVAAAEGTRAAFGINRALTREDFAAAGARRGRSRERKAV